MCTTFKASNLGCRGHVPGSPLFFARRAAMHAFMHGEGNTNWRDQGCRQDHAAGLCRLLFSLASFPPWQACRLLKKRICSGAELGRLCKCRVRGRHGSGRAELCLRPEACAAMANAVSQDAVCAKLGELLDKADLSTVSERMLLNSLVGHFGEEVRTVHKQLVKVASPYRPPCAAQWLHVLLAVHPAH